jgi:hypothetical protein
MGATDSQRQEWIKRYAEGPARLKAALATVPDEALQWRPGPGRWSAHEVVVHCADSETNAAMRIRFLLAEQEPVIAGYDQDSWAQRFDYHAHPLSLALQTVEAVRANTSALLARLQPGDFDRRGRHTESGPYGVDDWLRIYSGHLDGHASQIEKNVAEYHSQRSMPSRPPG